MSLKYVTIIFILSIIQPVDCLLNAQETKNDTIKKSDETEISQDATSVIKWKPSTSLYVEILGKVYLSINVDFRITRASALSIGVLPWKDNFAPNLMYYHFFGKRRRIELGGGSTGIFNSVDGLGGIVFHAVIGYRYQKKKGLIFRTGFTPFYSIPITGQDKSYLYPWGGLSLGYCF